MKRHDFIIEPLDTWVQVSLQRLERSESVARMAVMPDVHLAENVCVGVVLACKDRLLPQAVGGDIGCGVSTVPLRLERPLTPDRAAGILGRLERLVPIHRRLPVLDPGLSGPVSPRLARLFREHGADFGTLGHGNHFLELQQDDQGGYFLVVHSGSRGLGPVVRDMALQDAKLDNVGLGFLEVDTPGGRLYLEEVQALEVWARASREVMLVVAGEIFTQALGGEVLWDERWGGSHNHVREEGIGGEKWWVHRKGAVSAQLGEFSVLPGSMGDVSYHVQGRGFVPGLCSGAHGAGRCLSRVEARLLSDREVRRQVGGVFVPDRDLREEAPAAYKKLARVQRAQSSLARVVRVLRPLLVYR